MMTNQSIRQYAHRVLAGRRYDAMYGAQTTTALLFSAGAYMCIHIYIYMLHKHACLNFTPPIVCKRWLPEIGQGVPPVAITR